MRMRGARKWNVFGSWRSDTVDHDDADVKDWIPVCTVIELIEHRNRKEQWAIDLSRTLQMELLNIPPPILRKKAQCKKT